MNLVDLYHLDRLRDGRAHFVRTKTSGKNINPVSILVQPEAAEIITRYAGTDHVLRFAEESATYQTFNNRIQKAIRAIAQELNIEGLTFTGRATPGRRWPTNSGSRRRRSARDSAT